MVEESFFRKIAASPHTLRAGERGAVLTMYKKFEFPGGGKVHWDSIACVDEMHLRTMLIMFDRLELPDDNAIIGRGIEEDLSFLAIEGILNRVEVDVGRIASPFIRDVQLEVFLKLDALSPGRWVIGRSEEDVDFHDNHLSPRRVLAMKLHNALPVFDKEVGFEDILFFKQRRDSELKSLRQCIDEATLSISEQPLDQFEATTAFEKFQNSLNDYQRVVRETNRRFIPMDLEINWSEAGASAVSMLAASSTNGVVSGLLTAASGAFSLKSVLGLKRLDRSGPFQYLTSISRELR